VTSPFHCQAGTNFGIAGPKGLPSKAQGAALGFETMTFVSPTGAKSWLGSLDGLESRPVGADGSCGTVIPGLRPGLTKVAASRLQSSYICRICSFAPNWNLAAESRFGQTASWAIRIEFQVLLEREKGGLPAAGAYEKMARPRFSQPFAGPPCAHSEMLIWGCLQAALGVE